MIETGGWRVVMKINNKDFVWLCNCIKGTIDWGYVSDEHIILQSGGFECLNDFKEDGKYFDCEQYFIGGFVRNATSFTSAQAFYKHHLSGEDRFLDHHTAMVAVSASKWAKGCYEYIMDKI